MPAIETAMTIASAIKLAFQLAQVARELGLGKDVTRWLVELQEMERRGELLPVLKLIRNMNAAIGTCLSTEEKRIMDLAASQNPAIQKPKEKAP